MMWNAVNQRINRALARIRLAFRTVLTTTDSAGKVQTVQAKGLGPEVAQGNELFQHYGFTSVPLPGTMAVFLPLGGVTTHSIVIATEHGAYRLKSLKPGEVALYTDEGAKIVLKRGKLIETDCDTFRVNCKTWEVNAEEKADFNTPMLTASEQLTAQQTIHGNGGMAIQGGDGATFKGNVKQTGGNYETDGNVITPVADMNTHQHPNGHDGQPTGTPMK